MRINRYSSYENHHNMNKIGNSFSRVTPTHVCTNLIQMQRSGMEEFKVEINRLPHMSFNALLIESISRV
jgi:hypothetical protein